MSRGFWSAALALVGMFGISAGGAVGHAKPPDLPIELQVECPEAREEQGIHIDFDLFGAKVVIKLQAPGMPAAKALNPVQQRAEQAREMFLIGDRCRARGDLAKARTCYEEAHVLSPESRFGRQAIQRLAEIDAARTGEVETSTTDEVEPPLNNRQFRDESDRRREAAPRSEDNLGDTVPLGLVPLQLISTDGVWHFHGKVNGRPLAIRDVR